MLQYFGSFRVIKKKKKKKKKKVGSIHKHMLRRSVRSTSGGSGGIARKPSCEHAEPIHDIAGHAPLQVCGDVLPCIAEFGLKTQHDGVLLRAPLALGALRVQSKAVSCSELVTRARTVESRARHPVPRRRSVLLHQAQQQLVFLQRPLGALPPCLLERASARARRGRQLPHRNSLLVRLHVLRRRQLRHDKNTRSNRGWRRRPVSKSL
mmetsp:Transcript_10935/g.23372  ORF Transcript_10935/g.23372 Transcript_10935/m.23372 type:complete len:208 (+) Transcript_10935:1212-1835(+)